MDCSRCQDRGYITCAIPQHGDRDIRWNEACPDCKGEYIHRALSILHRMATENTGWRSFFRRWYYSDEPLRNDAANLVREAGFGPGGEAGLIYQPENTRLVGDDRVDV